MTGAFGLRLHIRSNRWSSTKKRGMAPERNTAPGDFARVLREAAPYLGIGTALAATVGFSFALGFWLDRLLETKPAFSLVFGSCGVVLALFQFVRTASARPKPKPPSPHKLP